VMSVNLLKLNEITVRKGGWYAIRYASRRCFWLKVIE
jgi:hypothetical protein